MRLQNTPPQAHGPPAWRYAGGRHSPLCCPQHPSQQWVCLAVPLSTPHSCLQPPSQQRELGTNRCRTILLLIGGVLLYLTCSPSAGQGQPLPAGRLQAHQRGRHVNRPGHARGARPVWLVPVRLAHCRWGTGRVIPGCLGCAWKDASRVCLVICITDGPAKKLPNIWIGLD
jgi:hypothetical protein